MTPLAGAHQAMNAAVGALRPALLILSARACGYQGQHHRELAAVVRPAGTEPGVRDAASSAPR